MPYIRFGLDYKSRLYHAKMFSERVQGVFFFSASVTTTDKVLLIFQGSVRYEMLCSL